MQKVKMLGTTNKRFENRCGNIEFSQFSPNNTIFWFGNLHTSYVIECKINDHIMSIKTRNSEYTFELLDGAIFNEFKLTAEEIIEMEKLCE